MPLPAGTDFGSFSSKPLALAELSDVVTGTKFMVGVPMKPATNRLAGWSYTSPGVPTCWRMPAFMIAMRSPMVIASTWSCVT